MKKRKDGRYLLQRVIGGKQINIYGSSPEEVYDKLKEYKKAAGRPPTFDDLADRWEADKWDTFAPGTQNCYRSALERARDAFGTVPATDVAPADVQLLLDKLAAQKYSAKSVKTQKCVVSTIYRHAMIKDIYRGQNPALTSVVRRGLPKSTREPPEDDVIKKILADDWLFPKLLYYTGLRRGEALALNGEDIDREKKTITVNKEIIYKGNQPIKVDRTKTAAGNREVPIPDALLALLPQKTNGPLFESTLRVFKTKWQKFEERIKAHVTPHQLRHAYATLLHDADIDVKDAQIILGHSDVHVTQNIYTHIDLKRKTLAAARLNAYLNQSPDSVKNS